jgi:glycosyltransferase involved in cell wall biosynthesis
MSAPLAVLLPVHNTGEYLQQAVESVLNQTFTDFTLLLMDDGSTDAETLRIMAGYEQTPRVRILRNRTNKGLAATLNIGLDAALADPSCEFVARMDADDICHPERFARQVAHLQKQPHIGLLGTQCLRFGEGHETDFEHWPTTPKACAARLLFHVSFSHPATMFRASVLRDTSIRFDESLPYTEDYDLWLRLQLDHDIPGTNLGEPLLRYRMNPMGMSRQTAERGRKLADNVRARVLKRLGLQPTPQELHLHNAIARGDLEKTRDFVSQATHWLRRLHQTNETTRIFDPAALAGELDLRLMNVCEHAAVLGPAVWRQWRRTAFSPKRGHWRLLAKCLLRWDNDRASERGLRKRIKDTLRSLNAGGRP